mmetsp:Transcript_4673/g.13061  ORF Transcript_4673/g.13061 Transcript_4673/m.13061 type:complete len:459 (+) Transcript_4673:99-1475(+)
MPVQRMASCTTGELPSAREVFLCKCARRWQRTWAAWPCLPHGMRSASASDDGRLRAGLRECGRTVSRMLRHMPVGGHELVSEGVVAKEPLVVPVRSGGIADFRVLELLRLLVQELAVAMRAPWRRGAFEVSETETGGKVAGDKGLAVQIPDDPMAHWGMASWDCHVRPRAVAWEICIWIHHNECVIGALLGLRVLDHRRNVDATTDVTLQKQIAARHFTTVVLDLVLYLKRRSGTSQRQILDVATVSEAAHTRVCWVVVGKRQVASTRRWPLPEAVVAPRLGHIAGELEDVDVWHVVRVLGLPKRADGMIVVHATRIGVPQHIRVEAVRSSPGPSHLDMLCGDEEGALRAIPGTRTMRLALGTEEDRVGTPIRGAVEIAHVGPLLRSKIRTERADHSGPTWLPRQLVLKLLNEGLVEEFHARRVRVVMDVVGHDGEVPHLLFASGLPAAVLEVVREGT